jgi:hypothetical protein
MTFHFWKRLTAILLFYSVRGNANSTGHTDIKCQKVLPPVQAFFFNGQALTDFQKSTKKYSKGLLTHAYIHRLNK